MALPTPSDLLWVTGFPDQGRWLIPLLREAVQSGWSDAVSMAESQLGDDPGARELMECAIAQAQKILVDQREASIDDVRRVLMRCYKNAVRRVVSRIFRTFILSDVFGRLLGWGLFGSGPHGGQSQKGHAMATTSASRSIWR